jgi:Protein of unknown function (DUF4038)
MNFSPQALRIKLRLHFSVSILLLFSQWLSAQSIQPWAQHGRLIVSQKDAHYLSFADGTTFFWLGDTGWEMIHLLKREEISDYYRIRKEQGFNVIQTVIISEFDGLTKPNAYSSLPFTYKNPRYRALKSSANQYDYWDHVDFAVQEAARQGLFVALLPCWGEYVIPREGHAIFFDEATAYEYGNFLGIRDKKQKNIVWILGGDPGCDWVLVLDDVTKHFQAPGQL